MPNIEKKPEDSNENMTMEPVMPEAFTEPPDWLPLKFWDAKKGEIRLQALAKSYRLLEKRLSASQVKKAEAADVEKPVDKSVEKAEEVVDKSVDEVIDNNNNHNNKDNNSIADSIADSIDDNSNNDTDISIADVDIGALTSELEGIFGGADKWQRLRPQLLAWGRRNLPEDAFAVLSSSVEGVKALHGLMSAKPSEPRLVRGGDLPQGLDESRLRRMMEDPRYWREREPQFVNRVLRGFQQLYGG